MAERSLCKLCGEPMPCGEEMFNYHGYSGRCPKKHGVASEPAPTPCPCMVSDNGYVYRLHTPECPNVYAAEPAVERPTPLSQYLSKTYEFTTQGDSIKAMALGRELFQAGRAELESELSSLRRELEHHTSECRRLDADGDKWMNRAALAEQKVDELKAALRQIGKLVEGFHTVRDIEEALKLAALGTEEGNRG